MKRSLRRILTLLLPLALLLSAGAYAAPAEDALLPKTRAYEGQFADLGDVSPVFLPYIAASYEYGLFDGRDQGFAPHADVTVAELLTLSARIRAAYEGDSIRGAEEGEAWYLPYVTYLDGLGLLDGALTDYDASATRAQLADVFAFSLPEDCFDGRNALLVTDAYASGGYIADVEEYTPYQPQILWLYRQGILAGMDESGSYWPDKPTSRAEVAAVVTRLVDPSLRISLGWEVPPVWSVAGATLASLVSAPDGPVSTAPAYNDAGAIDALVRQMLAAGENTISLDYPARLADTDGNTLAHIFSDRVKTYCEQMYNVVSCTLYWNSGHATLEFTASACQSGTDEENAAQLAQYREKAMARAIEVHDMLWESGALTEGMSEYEIARVYYLWLCDNCAYDFQSMNDAYSVSHLAYAALVNGKAVCDGYTGAYNLFLKLEGIDCYALVKDSINHIWTVAALDGTEYHIDVTWGDQAGWVDMRFFGMSAAQSEAAHARRQGA